jgi:hypothetical protein
MDDRHFGYIKKLNKKPSPHANVKVTYIDINGQNWIFEAHNNNNFFIILLISLDFIYAYRM